MIDKKDVSEKIGSFLDLINSLNVGDFISLMWDESNKRYIAIVDLEKLK